MTAWAFLSSLTVSSGFCYEYVHGTGALHHLGQLLVFWLIHGIKVYPLCGDTPHKPDSFRQKIIAGDQKMPAGCRLFPEIAPYCQPQSRRTIAGTGTEGMNAYLVQGGPAAE